MKSRLYVNDKYNAKMVRDEYTARKLLYLFKIMILTSTSALTSPSFPKHIVNPPFEPIRTSNRPST